MTYEPWYDELYIDLTTLMWTLVGKHHVLFDLANSDAFDGVLSHSSRQVHEKRLDTVLSGKSVAQKFHGLNSRGLD